MFGIPLLRGSKRSQGSGRREFPLMGKKWDAQRRFLRCRNFRLTRRGSGGRRGALDVELPAGLRAGERPFLNVHLRASSQSYSVTNIFTVCFPTRRLVGGAPRRWKGQKGSCRATSGACLFGGGSPREARGGARGGRFHPRALRARQSLGGPPGRGQSGLRGDDKHIPHAVNVSCGHATDWTRGRRAREEQPPK